MLLSTHGRTYGQIRSTCSHMTRIYRLNAVIGTAFKKHIEIFNELADFLEVLFHLPCTTNRNGTIQKIVDMKIFKSTHHPLFSLF